MSIYDSQDLVSVLTLSLPSMSFNNGNASAPSLSSLHKRTTMPSRPSQPHSVKERTNSLPHMPVEPSGSHEISRQHSRFSKTVHFADELHSLSASVEPASTSRKASTATKASLSFPLRRSPAKSANLVDTRPHPPQQTSYVGSIHKRTNAIGSNSSSASKSRFPPSKDNRRHKITPQMFMEICANREKMCFVRHFHILSFYISYLESIHFQTDPCIRCRTLGLACLMPTLQQVIGRPRPTCWECKSTQNLHDANICSFSDLLRYPPLQSLPASVPRLLAVPLASQLSSLPPNNRARAADRRVYVSNIPRVTLRLPHRKTPFVAPCPPPSPPRPTPTVELRPRDATSLHPNVMWIGEYAWMNTIHSDHWVYPASTSHIPLRPPSPDDIDPRYGMPPSYSDWSDILPISDRPSIDSPACVNSADVNITLRGEEKQQASEDSGKQKQKLYSREPSLCSLPCSSSSINFNNNEDLTGDIEAIEYMAPSPSPRIPDIGEAGPSNYQRTPLK